MINSHFNNLTYRTKNRWRSIDTHFQNGAVSLILSLLGWNTANTSFMIVCILSPSRLLMMQDQKSLTRRWLSCSGWGKEHVSLVFSYKGGWFIRNGQWFAKVNILWLTVGYLNATINRKTRNPEPEIGTDRASQTRQNLQVDRYGSGFGPPRRCGLGFWRVLEAHRTVFTVRTQTAGGQPGPVANTISELLSMPISANMWSISTRSAKYLVSLHFKWRTWPGWGLNSTTLCGGGALGRACSSLFCSGRSASLDELSLPGSGYNAGSLTGIDRNVSVSHRKIRESTQVSSGDCLFDCLEVSLWSSVSPITNDNQASCHRTTLHAPDAPYEV